jgi:hypothetical protein
MIDLGLFSSLRDYLLKSEFFKRNPLKITTFESSDLAFPYIKIETIESIWAGDGGDCYENQGRTHLQLTAFSKYKGEKEILKLYKVLAKALDEARFSYTLERKNLSVEVVLKVIKSRIKPSKEGILRSLTFDLFAFINIKKEIII